MELYQETVTKVITVSGNKVILKFRRGIGADEEPVPRDEYSVEFETTRDSSFRLDAVTMQQGTNVLLHVLDGIREFRDLYHPKALHFTGKETYQSILKDRVYARIADRLLGGKVEHNGQVHTVRY